MVMDKYQTAVVLGRWAELQFQLDAIKAGLIVYAPVQSYPNVDCIVGNGERLFRVQVKASSVVASGTGRNAYRFSRGGGLKTYFKSESFDVLAGLCADTCRWVFAQSHLLDGKRHTGMPVNRRALRKNSMLWTDWSIFAPSGSHQPAHQLTRPIPQPSPEL